MEIIETNELSKVIKSDNVKENLITNFECNKAENDLEFWKDKWFEKIPNWEDFAKWWFKREEVVMLIDIIKNSFGVSKNWKFYIKYGELVNHFVRNWSYSALTWDFNKKKLAYDRFVYLINLIKDFDENQKISFLEKIKYIYSQKITYPKWSNRIEMMIWEIEHKSYYD